MREHSRSIKEHTRYLLNSYLQSSCRYSDAVVHDLENMHATLKKLLENANLPIENLLPLQSSVIRDSQAGSTSPQNDVPARNGNITRTDNYGPSCDNSPKISPEDEGLPYVPIHSLYALTKLRALRSPEETTDTQREKKIDDIISRGAVRMEDAERLFRLYRDRLDSFMYGIGVSRKYKTLAKLRSRSTILTISILTVAALHDAKSNAIYGVCSAEFKRLMEKSMFERRVDRDYIRAMAIASYWLSDMSWILSGWAIRRAAECNLHTSPSRFVAEQTEEAADCARLWYILYICDQHLATLYGRPSIVQDDASVHGWESFVQSPLTNDEDLRMASQVALLNILKSIRELFGPDKGEPIPKVYLNQISHFNRQLDQWIGYWSNTLRGE